MQSHRKLIEQAEADGYVLSGEERAELLSTAGIERAMAELDAYYAENGISSTAQEAYVAIVDKYSRLTMITDVNSSESGLMTTSDGRISLNMTLILQENEHYCGPATVKSVVSKITGSSNTQSYYASQTFLAGLLAVEGYGRYVAMMYTVWSEDSVSQKSTCVICYDLETETWKEIILCGNSSVAGENYTGGIVTEIGVSDEYLTWIQLEVSGETYHSEAGSAYAFQYSLSEGKIEKLFEVPRDVNKVWGDEQLIITTDYISDPDSMENTGRFYVKKDGAWYQHSIPNMNARARRQTAYVQRLDKNRYVFLAGQYIYVYDLAEQTYHMLDIDQINEEGSPWYSSYRAYYLGEKAICWQYNIDSKKVTLYEVDLINE